MTTTRHPVNPLNRENIFFQIFSKYYGTLCVYAGNLTKDPEEAMSIVNEVFTKYWLKDFENDDVDKTRYYLIRMVQNEYIDRFRKIKTYQTHLEAYKNEMERIHAITKEEESLDKILEKIYEIVEKMPERRKQVFKLIYIEGFNRKEVADKLDISEHTVKNLQYQAINQLRNVFGINQVLIFILYLAYDSLKN